MYVPTNIQESFNSTVGGAVPVVNTDGGGFAINSGDLHSIRPAVEYRNFEEWFVFGRKTRDVFGSSVAIRLINSSGSLP